MKEAFDLTHESRLLKEIETITGSGIASEAVVAGRWEPGYALSERVGEHATFCRIPMLRGSRYPLLLAIRRWDAYRRLARLADTISPLLIECHEVETLDWCCRLKKRLGAALIYAPHELETEKNGLTGPERAAARLIERKYIALCDSVICVGDAIADWYGAEYDIPRPIVVRNTSALTTAPAPGTSYRRLFGIPADDLIFVYQGALYEGRQIEQFLRVFARLGPDRHLVLMGYGSLESRVRQVAERVRNIHFLPAVPPDQVLNYSSSADVGLVGGENVCLSYYYSLPNKLFAYLAAGLPVIANDLPEISALIRQHRVGWVASESDDDWLTVISGMSRADIAARRANVTETARLFTWDTDKKILAGEYRRVLQDGHRATSRNSEQR